MSMLTRYIIKADEITYVEVLISTNLYAKLRTKKTINHINLTEGKEIPEQVQLCSFAFQHKPGLYYDPLSLLHSMFPCIVEREWVRTQWINMQERTQQESRNPQIKICIQIKGKCIRYGGHSIFCSLFGQFKCPSDDGSLIMC